MAGCEYLKTKSEGYLFIMNPLFKINTSRLVFHNPVYESYESFIPKVMKINKKSDSPHINSTPSPRANNLNQENHNFTTDGGIAFA